MYKSQTRIYYDNTDAQGIVYHSKYLDIFERVRTDFLRSKGITQTTLFKEFQSYFVVRKLNLEYKKPAIMDDVVEITLEITNNNGLIMNMSQNMYLISRYDKLSQHELLATLNLDIIMINKEQKPIRMQKDILNKLK